MPLFTQSLGNIIDKAGTRFNLPEFGISELVAGRATANTNTGRSSYAQQSFPQITAGGTSYYNPGVLGTSSTNNPTPTPSYGGGGTTQLPTNTAPNQEQTVNQNANDLQAQADFEFEQAMNILNEQEGALRGQAQADIGAQEQAGKKAQARAGEAKQANLGALAEEGQSAEKSANLGLRQARDLYRETQQQNIAQLSALGISSSSVTEALAERLGVETARRIGGITGSLEEVRQNIAKEKTRVEEVFQSKLTEIQESTEQAMAQVRAGLATALSQIASQRGQAAVEKQRQRTDIAINARNLIQQIQMEAQQRAQSVQTAAARRAQALQEAEQFMFKPTDFSGLQNYINQVGNISAQGLNVTPTFTPTQVQGQAFLQPGVDIQRPDEDQIINPFATQ